MAGKDISELTTLSFTDVSARVSGTSLPDAVFQFPRLGILEVCDCDVSLSVPKNRASGRFLSKLHPNFAVGHSGF